VEILVAFALLMVVYGTFSKRLAEASVTPYIVFVTVGLLLGFSNLEFFQVTVSSEGFILAGELALALTLFNDASRIDLRALKGSAGLPVRLLGIGMPLTIGLGAAFAAWILGLPLVEALLVGAVLAPTDAGLGQSVVTSDRVPLRIRQALNVESGLNDGIATPIVVGLIALTAEASGGSPLEWGEYALRLIGVGALVGVGVGALGGWLSRRSRAGMLRTYRWLAIPSIAFLAYGVADLVGGNGFVAAFAAGLSLAWAMRGVSEGAAEFSEAVGHTLVLAVFFMFGVMISGELTAMGWDVWLYAALSLTVVRMLPVAISMMGSRLSAWSTGFLGWFGPRGLASIVLGLIVFEGAVSDHLGVIISVVGATVLLSVFLHGVSSGPLVRRYEGRTDEMDARAPEKKDVADVPTRGVTSAS
jgi:NhaP-type Na+/H+ or K+/H+ antiporter